MLLSKTSEERRKQSRNQDDSEVSSRVMLYGRQVLKDTGISHGVEFVVPEECYQPRSVWLPLNSAPQILFTEWFSWAFLNNFFYNRFFDFVTATANFSTHTLAIDSRSHTRPLIGFLSPNQECLKIQTLIWILQEYSTSGEGKENG